MLGLRPENDQTYYKGLQRQAPQFNKNTRFASGLNGRFFVSGVSGSFTKHQKQLMEFKEQENLNRIQHEVETQQLQSNNNQEDQIGSSQAVPVIHYHPSKKIVRKYTYQPVLEKHQREELRKDAQRLLELEEKLNEVIKFQDCSILFFMNGYDRSKELKR